MPDNKNLMIIGNTLIVSAGASDKMIKIWTTKFNEATNVIELNIKLTVLNFIRIFDFLTKLYFLRSSVISNVFH